MRVDPTPLFGGDLHHLNVLLPCGCTVHVTQFAGNWERFSGWLHFEKVALCRTANWEIDFILDLLHHWETGWTASQQAKENPDARNHE